MNQGLSDPKAPALSSISHFSEVTPPPSSVHTPSWPTALAFPTCRRQREAAALWQGCRACGIVPWQGLCLHRCAGLASMGCKGATACACSQVTLTASFISSLRLSLIRVTPPCSAFLPPEGHEIWIPEWPPEGRAGQPRSTG